MTGAWLRSIPGSVKLAIGFALPIDRWCVRPEVQAMQRAAGWFVPLGLGLGIVWAWVFWAAWGRFGEITGLRVMPAAAVVLVSGLLVQIKWWIGLGRTVDQIARTAAGNQSHNGGWPNWGSAGTLGVVLVIIVWFALLLSLPNARWTPPPGRLGGLRWLWPLFPRPILRVLVLAPLWGMWAVTVAASMGRRAESVDPAMEGLARAMSPARLLGFLAFPLFLTTLYFWMPEARVTGLRIALLTMAGTFLICVAVARGCSGHTRWSALGMGALVQVLYLALYTMFMWQARS